MELLILVALIRTLVLRELLVFHLLVRWHALPHVRRVHARDYECELI